MRFFTEKYTHSHISIDALSSWAYLMLRSSSVKVLFHACYSSRRVASCRAYSILQFFSPLDSSWVDSRFPGDCFFAETSSSLSPQSTLGLPFGWQALPKEDAAAGVFELPGSLFPQPHRCRFLHVRKVLRPQCRWRYALLQRCLATFASVDMEIPSPPIPHHASSHRAGGALRM